MLYIYIYPIAAHNPATVLTSYNLWVAVWWYGLVVYDFGRTGFVNGTIRCAYFKGRFRLKTSIFGSLGVTLALLGSILVDWAAPGTPKVAQREKEWILEAISPSFGFPF